MKRTMTAAAVLLAATLFAGIAVAQPAAKAPAPPLADKLPADCIVYVGWGGAGPNADALKQTGIGQIINDAEVKPHVEAMLAQLETFLKKQAEDKLPPGAFDAIRSLVLDTVVDRPWAISFMDLKMPMGPGQPLTIDAALVVDLGDKADETMKNVDTLIKALVPQEVQAKIVEVEVAGVKMKSLPLDENAPTLFWGVADKHLVVTLNKATAEKVLPLVSGVENQALGRLTKNPQFTKVFARTGGGMLCFYADVTRFRKELLPMIMAGALRDPEKAAEANRLIEAVGGEAIDALAFSLRPDGKEFVSRCYLLAPRGKPGLLVLADQKPLNDSLLTVVPEDSTFAFAFNLNRVQVLDELEKQLAKFPDTKQQFDQFRGQIEATAGINLKTDLAEPLGDGVAIYNSPAAGGFLITGLTIVGEAKDPGKLRASLMKVEDAIIKQFTKQPDRVQAPGAMGQPQPDAEKVAEFKSAKFGNVEYRYLTTRGVPMPFAISWCVTDKYVVISTFPQTLKAALLKIEAGKAGSLLANKWFADQVAGVKGASAVSYVNDRQLARMAYPVLLPVWQIACSYAAKAGVQLDMNAMPRQALIEKHLSDTFGACVPDSEGVLGVTRGSGVSLGSVLVAAPLFAAMSVPAAMSAQAQGQRMQSAANLRGLANTIMIYRAENDDQFPDTLEDLVKAKKTSPEVLHAPADKTGKVSYVYIKPVDPNPANNTKVILAYERPDINNNSGVNVLFMDGHVKWHTMAEFKKLLAEQPGKTSAGPPAGDAGRSL